MARTRVTIGILSWDDCTDDGDGLVMVALETVEGEVSTADTAGVDDDGTYPPYVGGC